MCTRVPFSFHSKSFFGNTSARGSQSASACGSVHNSSIPRATCLDRGRSGPAGNMRAHPQSTVGLRCMSGTGTVNLSYACSHTHTQRETERDRRSVSVIYVLSLSLSLSLSHPPRFYHPNPGRKPFPPAIFRTTRASVVSLFINCLLHTYFHRPPLPFLSQFVSRTTHTQRHFQHMQKARARAISFRRIPLVSSFFFVVMTGATPAASTSPILFATTAPSTSLSIHTFPPPSLSLSLSLSLTLFAPSPSSSSSSCGYSRCPHRHAIRARDIASPEPPDCGFAKTYEELKIQQEKKMRDSKPSKRER